MSYTEYKTVIRVKLDFLNGKTKNEVYDYFQNVIGAANDVDEYDGEIEWFSYKDDKGNFSPVQSYRTNEWGVDFVLAHSDYNGNNSDVNLSVGDIKNYCKMLSDKFGVDESNCRLLSYSWYNGGDEPINF